MVQLDNGAGDEYLLIDAKDRIFLWNSMTMMIWRFTNQMTLPEAVTMVRRDTYEGNRLAEDLDNGYADNVPCSSRSVNKKGVRGRKPKRKVLQ